MTPLNATGSARVRSASRWRRIVVVAILLALPGAGRHASFAQDTSTASAPPVLQAPQKPPDSLPFGLSCDQCARHSSGIHCQDIAKAPVVAVVSAAREVEILKSCSKQRDPELGRYQSCHAFAAVRFGAVEFLRNERGAKPGDRFLTSYRWESWTPDKKEGLFLRPDRRYALFAGNVNPNAQPKAEWFTAAACELPP